MALNQHSGGGRLIEQWTNATQPGDPTPAGYTAWDAAGNVTTTRALTAAEATALASQDTANTAAGNQATIQQQATAALANNATDKTQDQNIISQAAGVIAAPPTTLAAMTPVIKALAQAVNTLAQNDLNTKAELNALIRLALGKFDATS